MTLPGLGALRCPHCGAELHGESRRLLCPNNHAFDLAKQGYAPLVAATSNLTTADTATQVAARQDFLDTGAYAPFHSALRQAAETDAPGIALELGCGTGYYLADFLEHTERTGIGIDTSKYALRRAAKAHPRMTAILADGWQRLPIADNAVAVALNVFAPRNRSELHRVLHPHGRLVTLTPNSGHLHPLPEYISMLSAEENKEQRLSDTLSPDFQALSHTEVTRQLTMSQTMVCDLIRMGPTARHWDDAELTTAITTSVPSELDVTVSVTITAWQRNPSSAPSSQY
ncbi:putative RNA methyltransferase [Haloglycomyces albus]|uniref:putative RNA methyltransferase n=1 Tax=Haloglycomyces albus TaxID=526067 RepID=UPI00046D6219|nr:methyltransferase domain-containing protein [Haloglycomyces albus]